MKPKIVIAEDEVLTRMDLIEILQGAGYDVVGEANDGIEALNLCKTLKPDIVLLDIKMPLMTGLDVAKILKEENAKTCVLILTAYNIEEYIYKAAENSVMGYLTKPIDEKIFLSRLHLTYQNYLKMKKLEDKAILSEKKLKERKIIEKAKGILMEVQNLNEEDAYKKIREISMTKRMQMAELAEIIVLTGGSSL